jgi:hypothetical protein
MVPGHSLLDVSVTDEEVKLGGVSGDEKKGSVHDKEPAFI